MFRPRLPASVLPSVVFAACFALSFPGAASTGRVGRRVELVPSPPGAAVRVVVMTPPSYDTAPARRFPTLYFLHDGGGDEEVFFRHGLADILDAAMRDGSLPEMLVVSPRGVGTWFVDGPQSEPGPTSRYGSFLSELVPFVDARYRTIASSGGRLTAGISMGGYGALRWALAEPGVFSAAGGLSPAIQQMCWDAMRGMPFFIRPSLERAFGRDPVRNVLRRNDLYAMLLDDRTLAARAPFLLVRCGTEDRYRLAEIASFLDRYLDALGVGHGVVIERGGHDWAYWKTAFAPLVRALAGHLAPPETAR